MESKFDYTEKVFEGFKSTVYRCTIQNTYCTGDPEYYHENIRGLSFCQHLEEKRNSDVRELIVQDSQFKKLPKFSYVFNYIVHLKINNCNLTTADVESYEYPHYLISLSLDNNNIECVPGSFRKTLKHLSMVDNKISSIDDKFIDYMKKSSLTFLDLRNNSSYDVYYDSNSTGTMHDFLKKLKESKMTPFSISDTLENANKFLWESSELSDFTIKAGNKEFKVHKMLLAANSPVLRRMFQNNVQETMENKMTISDFNSRVVQDFLEFIYMAKVPENNETLTDLFAISAKYDVKHLKKHCEKKIRKNLNEENVGQALELAILFDCEMMIEEGFEFMEKMFGGLKISRKLKAKQILSIIEARKSLESANEDVEE